MSAPVSLCIIVKNEPILEKCLRSIRKYVKEIVVVDTGSTDDTTVEVAKKYADIFEIFTSCNSSAGLIEDFSLARQRSFDLATQPWILWCDADDIIEGGQNLPTLVSDFEKNYQHLDSVSYLFPYEYSYNELGQCTLQHYRERLFYNKKCYHWVNPVHEVCIPNDNVRTTHIPREDLIFKHQRQYSPKAHEPGRNLRILKKYYEKVGDNDARQLYYLGLEYANAGLVEESIKHLIKYITLSGWEDERVMACLKLVDIYQGLNNLNEAIKWAFKAIEIKENWCEGYLALSRMFYFLALRGGPNEQRNWERCVYFGKAGLALPPTKTLLFINPLERESEIHKYLNLAFNKLGDVKAALDSVNIGIQKQPNDASFINNKRLYEDFLARQKIVENTDILKRNNSISSKEVEQVAALINGQSIGLNLPKDNSLSNEQLQSLSLLFWKQYSLYDNADRAIAFLESLPPNVKNEPTIHQALQDSRNFLFQLNEKKSSLKEGALDIIFFAGDGLEIWTPETVKQTGIGGSELMLLEMAKRLSELGHRVRVYNSCGNVGIYNGVEYHLTREFQNLSCDVLVVSRRTEMLDDKFNVTAKLKLLWVHDIFALSATNELLLKADRILALSNWHKQTLVANHNIHPEHIIVTRNGIDLTRFKKKVIRNPLRCINSSSPDRSWPILLEVWPKIRERVPKAELHLYYGFKNWELSAQHDQGQMNLINFLKQRIKELESHGVFYHDRVNQEQLAEEFLSSGCWIYPTWFSETSCITAMEAQAAGLFTVSSSIAALNETVGKRGVLLDGDWTSQPYKDKFIESVVKSLLKTSNSERLHLQQYAKKHFGLNDLAKDWSNMLYSLIEEIKINPITPYYPTNPYKKNGRGYHDGDTRLQSKENNMKEKTKKLNIASGPNVFPFDGWLNYDRQDISEYLQAISKYSNLNGVPAHQQNLIRYLQNGGVINFKTYDLCNGFAHHLDNSIDMIYLGQMIEHLNPIYEAPKFLQECFRMLQKNGLLRITTPDLDLLIKAYLEGQMDKFSNEQPGYYKNAEPSAQLALLMYGAGGPQCTWNNYEGHMCLYTQKSMHKLLSSVGFREIEFYYEAGKSKNPVMATEAVDMGLSHSFIVEAIK